MQKEARPACAGNHDQPRLLGGELHHVSHEIRRLLDSRIAAELGPELTGMRGMVLGYMVRSDEAGVDVFQRDIELRFHIRRSSVTGLLQGMEQANLITRCPVKQDARLKKLVATEYGRRCSKRICAIIETHEADVTAGIPPAELAALRDTLQKLVENLRRMEQRAQDQQNING